MIRNKHMSQKTYHNKYTAQKTAYAFGGFSFIIVNLSDRFL